MSEPRRPTGFVRAMDRVAGPVFYAQIRTADGKRLQRKLGRAWLKRSRPPEGFITRAQAELKLAEVLAGRDTGVPVEPQPGADVTFRQACEEWMRYVEFDRKRRPSTIRDYRREIEKRLIPEFGEQTPLSQITTAEIEAFRERMVAEGVLSADDQQAPPAAPHDLQAGSASLGPAGESRRGGRAAASAALRRFHGARAA